MKFIHKGLPPLLLVLLTFIVFCPVLKFQFAPFWDDADKVLGNPDYHAARLSHLAHYWVPPPHETFFVPLTYTVYGLLTMGAGFNPMVFHAANLFCHIVSAVLVYLILKHLLGLTKPAWLGAAVFAIHPVQVDPVAWIGTLYTPLSSMFGLLAIWMYLRFAEAGPVPGTPGKPAQRRLSYWIGTVAFILALVAKPSAVVIPVMVAAIEIGLYRRRIRELFFPLGLWGALCVPIVVINRLAYPGNTVFAPPPWQRVIVALDTIAFYLWKIVWPFDLVPDYGRSPRWVVNHPMVWLTCFVPIAIYVVCRVYWRRIPWLGVGFAVFVAGLIPVLGLTPFDFQIYSTPADRYVSLSMLGVAIVVAFVLARVDPLSLREKRAELATARERAGVRAPGEGEAPAEPGPSSGLRLGRSLALPEYPHSDPLLFEPEPEAQPQSRRPEGEGVGGRRRRLSFVITAVI